MAHHMALATIDGGALSARDEAARNDYNTVFAEMDIGWHWDAETYGSLLAQADGREPVRIYIEQHRPHLLRAYAMDCLVNAIETMRRDRVRAWAW
jgi:hypothetical protein